MVWWQKPVHKNGWEDDESSDEPESDARFTRDKNSGDRVTGTFTKSDGKVLRVEEVKTSTGVHYREIKK